MFENVFSHSSNKSSTKRRNNRKRAKVFDPCISNKKKKVDDDLFGDENNSFDINNQFNTIKKNLLSSSKKDLNKTMDELCNELGMNKYVSEDDISDCENKPEVPKTKDSIERCLNKIFEGLDDYAAFNAKGVSVSTPKESRTIFSDIDSSIKPTPGLSSMPRPKSILKLNNDNFVTPKRGDVTPFTSFTETKVISFGSPRFHDSASTSRTPFIDKTNVLQPCNSNKASPCQTPASHYYTVPDSMFTPAGSTPNISKPSLSPGMIELPPEIKRTLLVGVYSYVEVRTNKEDCSSSVALELLSMGACVEKTFNKKVTHVVFKEGKPSTYLKAKNLGITMVSVLWLEACKKERSMVDPALYPPVNVEKYESLSPSGRKLPSLKTIQKKIRKHLLREAGLLSADNRSKVRTNWRNAVTDIKMKPRGSQENSQGRLCNKKLDFLKSVQDDLSVPDNERLKNSQECIVPSDSSSLKPTPDESIYKSDSSSSDQTSVPVERRNSAPGRFVSERKKRKRKVESEEQMTASQKFMTIDKLFAKQTTLNQAKKIRLFNDDGLSDSTQSSQIRKRKLFNPEEAIIIIDSPDQHVSTPPPMVYEFPYENELNSLSTNKCSARTKSTSLRKIFTKVIKKKPAARKSLASLLEQDEGNSSSRSSLTYFIDPKKPEQKIPKEPPTIVCTSLLPETVRKVSYVIGKLGVFDVEDKVSFRTTHLVTSAPRRTVNLLKALVRGSWILHIDWLYKSEEAGYWLNEEEFELKTFSHTVTEMRRERQAFGPEFCSELFSNCGPMYVSKKSVPPCADLAELIRLCKGHIVNKASSAEFIIGGKPIKGESTARIKEKWILDSITQNSLLDTDRYFIKVDKT